MRFLVVVTVLAACSKDSAKPPAPAPALPAPALAPRHHQWEPPAKASKEAPDPKRPPAEPWPAGAFDLQRELPSAFGSGEKIGGAHRVMYAKADPQARWALLCEQRRDTDGDGTISYESMEHFSVGDRPQVWLVFGGGTGAEVDDVLAISEDGGHLVLAIDRSTLLIDVATHSATVLDHARRAAAFTHDGKRVVYLEADGPKRRLVRRDLATGESKRFDVPDKAESVLPDGTGRWVQVLTASRGDRFEWHAPLRNWCSLSRRGGATEDAWVWLDTDTGNLLTDPNLVRPIGTHLLTKKGEAVAIDGKPFPPAKCDEVDLMGVYEPNAGVLVLCFVEGPKFTLHYVADGIAPIAVAAQPTRVFDPVPPLLTRPNICFWGSTGSKCLDFATGKIAPGTADEDPPYPSRRDNVQEYAFANDKTLVGAVDGNGPLWWQPK